MCILIAVVSYRISDYQVQLEAAGVIFLGHLQLGFMDGHPPKYAEPLVLLLYQVIQATSPYFQEYVLNVIIVFYFLV